MPISPLLPQEIYDIIIVNLRDDNPSLKACSLVASTWRGTSQALLHRTMLFRTTILLPEARDADEEPSAPDPHLGSEKIHHLLTTSSHLLRHARSFVIRGDRIELIRMWTCKTPMSKGRRVRDPSLASFVRNPSILELSSLATIELFSLTWSAIDTDLQHGLISLISQTRIKEVRLVFCAIPVGIPLLAFVGPETKSLKLDRVALVDDNPNTSIENIPVSSAPKLAHLDIGRSFPSAIRKWILQLPHGPVNPSASTTVALRSCLWRENITTFSVYCRTATEGLHGLIQEFPGLKTLELNAEGCVTPFPFDWIVRIPSLDCIHILSLLSKQIPWLSASFQTIHTSHMATPGLGVTTTSQTTPKMIIITMCVDTEEVYARIPVVIPEITFPELLVALRKLDGVVADIPWIKVNMMIMMGEIRSDDQSALIELQADATALKLEVI